MVEAQLEADIGENAVARLRYSKFEWDDTYGVGNTLLSGISPFDTALPYNGGLYYNSTFGYTGTNPATQDPYTVEHESHRGRHARGSQPHPSRLHLGPGRRDAEVFRRLSGVPVSHRLGQRRNAADRADQHSVPCRNAFADALSLDHVGRLRRRGSADAVHVQSSGYTATNVTTDLEGFYEEHQRWWSNEINCLSNGEGAVQWIVGLYQYKRRGTTRSTRSRTAINTLPIPRMAPSEPAVPERLHQWSPGRRVVCRLRPDRLVVRATSGRSRSARATPRIRRKASTKPGTSDACRAPPSAWRRLPSRMRSARSCRISACPRT